MKQLRISIFLILSFCSIYACVPAKKYNELYQREKLCTQEIENLKNRAILSEGLTEEWVTKYDVLEKKQQTLIQDTAQLGEDLRFLQTQYNKVVSRVESVEESFDKYRLTGEKQTSILQSDIEAKSIELQRKQDALNIVEQELQKKQQLLADRETRVNELEELLSRQEHDIQTLKQKVTNALKGFQNKGLTIHEKNGKIYVSLEAQLLFESGSIQVEEKGKKTLIALSKVLENEKNIEIIVEGHTDTDKLARSTHPRNNWELSVLRATSVIDILLQQSTINPQQLMAAGRSEFLPIDAQNKHKNRRIEIIIAPNLDELMQIVGK